MKILAMRYKMLKQDFAFNQFVNRWNGMGPVKAKLTALFDLLGGELATLRMRFCKHEYIDEHVISPDSGVENWVCRKCGRSEHITWY